MTELLRVDDRVDGLDDAVGDVEREHADFVDDLVARGIMVMGGPFSDHSGSLSLYEGVTEQEARTIAERDPWVANGVFVLEEVRSWNVVVDAVPHAAA